MMSSTMHRNQSGFTLIELAIVLVIIGVLIGSFIGTLGARIDTTRRAEAKADLELIKNAIFGYAYTNGAVTGAPFLPCPCVTECVSTVDNPGEEDRDSVSGVCVADYGYVPWGTLGLKPADSWNTLYRYWVDPDFSNSVSAFDLADLGSGRIESRSIDFTKTPLVVSNAVVVIYSHGKNMYGGLSIDGVGRQSIPADNVDEDKNGNGDSLFFYRVPSPEGTPQAKGGEFDDIVDWISDNEIKARMVEIGMLP